MAPSWFLHNGVEWWSGAGEAATEGAYDTHEIGSLRLVDRHFDTTTHTRSFTVYGAWKARARLTVDNCAQYY